ncbi:ATP-binding protein [Streptomyces sp. CB03238]|uniref:ATP-binding protein n=1 Tax=Streptomyces sp. CB03238 TaxID=1907777 RepID=UPI000A11F604|nr:ATP-binding protein [Streptomyces sp. CB03238]ORT53971.1 ATP-binding protein [Streptomyces sp. CB03238]
MDEVALDDGKNTVLPGTMSRAGVAYDGDSESIGQARRFVADFLNRVAHRYRMAVSSQAVGSAQLIVSELVTNACKYAPGPCAVDLQIAGQVLEITVWDSEPILPVARAAEPGRIGQHGLEIVIALCEGLEIQREPVGKRVKARVSLEPAAA